MSSESLRLTSFASGGGCACKIPARDLEELVRSLSSASSPEVLVGLEHGDDALVIRSGRTEALVLTTDFFGPVVDDPFEFGQIAAANALSDVYAMGGRPFAALNLLAWPMDRLPMEIATEVLRGGAEKCREAEVLIGGGHSITDAEPKYGLAVTGSVDPERMLRIDAAKPNLPLTLTKPLGVGILNNRHKATGERFPAAVESMTTLNREASAAAVAAGALSATDVTGFGLLGHLYKMARASGVSAVLNLQAIPVLDAAIESLGRGYLPGGSNRNLDWVRPYLSTSRTEQDLLILADAQTSGGLLVAGEVPGFPIIGHLTTMGESAITVL